MGQGDLHEEEEEQEKETCWGEEKEEEERGMLLIGEVEVIADEDEETEEVHFLRVPVFGVQISRI